MDKLERTISQLVDIADLASALLAFARRVRDNGHAHSPVIHGWAVKLLEEFEE